MILTAHQPVYMPWLGLFHKIALADQYCIFDIAQYQTKDFNNRNKIKTNNNAEEIKIEVKKSSGTKCTLCWKILDKKCERKNCGIA